jgi:hypothetical protein
LISFWARSSVMTEAEWLACRDPDRMLRFVFGSVKAGGRRFRLFAAACCRRVESLQGSRGNRRAVEAAERYADGLATDGELADASAAATLPAVRATAASLGHTAAVLASHAAANKVVTEAHGNRRAARAAERVAQSGLLRDIFGNPFRPARLDPRWLSWDDATVLKLAEAIYEERHYGDLPVLADALEDAGCDQADLLAHLRGPGPHVRGCWVVDLLLGKE